jgi:D-alanyl-D-alanine carboxypeptidase/D-alanyl-D-alanine-endopeptidase (penicillin-binding protein 4)
VLVVVRRIVVCALGALLCAPAPALALGRKGVHVRMKRALRAVGVHGGADLDTGRVLFSRRPDVARPPASVNKLYTTSTALARFGPLGTLETHVLTDAPPDADGVVDGNLWLRGDGDPTLTAARVQTLVGQLEAAGVTKVRGSVIGDGSVFDLNTGSSRTGGRFDWDMGGALAGLTVTRGLYRGRPDRRPALRAARALSGSLRRAGISVAGKTKQGRAPARADIVATTRSVPMRTLIALTNVPSDNYYAESLMKALGAHFGDGGTTAAGARVVREQVESYGIRPQIVDGSGLSRANLSAPRQVVGLLQHLYEDELGPTFRDSLAVVGRSGTVRYRMRGSAAQDHCQTKTGTINVVSALAGYCTARNGHTLAFAFLMSNVNVYSARVAQDRMAATIAAYGRRR